MPSKDPINPKANAWMEREGVAPSVPERPRATATARRAMSAQVQRLARRLGTSPDEIAAKIPPDTLRRTQYPVIETVNEDGTRSFKHDPGIEEGRRASLRR